MAVAAGVRALICAIAVPSRIRLVTAEMAPSGVNASYPHASEVQTESKLNRSAATAALTMSVEERIPERLSPRDSSPRRPSALMGGDGRVANGPWGRLLVGLGLTLISMLSCVHRD